MEELERLIGECQAAGHKLAEAMRELLDEIEARDPDAEHDELQEIVSRFANVEVEVQYCTDELDVPTEPVGEREGY